MNNMDNIVIIGSSGHARVIIDILESEKKFNIVGLLDQNRAADEHTLGFPILGKEEDLPALTKTYSLNGLIVAIGDNFSRSNVVRNVRELCPDLSFVCAIHPTASIARNVTIGEGTVIMAGVVVNSCSSVGRFCILNTQSSLDHDSSMGDFSSLAPKATTGGSCRIGEHSAVSIGAIVTNGITIGEHSVIGAGSLVKDHVAPFTVAYGTPARFIRARSAGDNYL